MNRLATAHRRRLARGVASRGLVVAVALVCAVALQLAGPRLQRRLASISGIARVAPAAPESMPASPSPSPSCGGNARGAAMHPCKLAVAGFTPAI